MKYALSQSSAGLNVKVGDSITFDDHAKMKALISEIEKGGSDHVELNLKELRAIDSAGIGLLLLLNDRMKSVGGTLILTNIPPVPGKILDVAKIGEVIEIR